MALRTEEFIKSVSNLLFVNYTGIVGQEREEGEDNGNTGLGAGRKW